MNVSSRLLRPSLIALCAMAQTVWPVASTAADAQPVRSQLQRPLVLTAGTQQELLIDKGIDRMAIGDEAVAGVTITRKTQNSPGARLIVTGKAAGRTSLMVW
jgi:pilus assembly protein CpaC